MYHITSLYISTMASSAGIRVYTIHDTSKHVFTMNVTQGNTKGMTPKRAVVAFGNNIDAIKTARLMEVHRALHDKWPETIMDESFDTSHSVWHPCRELFIRSWAEPKLQEFCNKNNLDIMYMCNTNQDILTLSIHIP